MQLTLFPLKTVLMPGNKLQLKIFEPRYSDMIAACMREDQPFGVVLIYQGQETDSEVEIFTIGTSAIVSDWQTRDDGLLGITAIGQRRFSILSTRTEPNGLLVADVEFLLEETDCALPEQFSYMRELLEHITAHKPANLDDLDFNQLVYQLIYLLPLENTLKQQLLEVPHCHDRAVVLHAELIRLGVIQYIKPGQEKGHD